MAASEKTRSPQSTTFHTQFQQSLSPSGQLEPTLTRSTSPTRISLARSISPSPSLRFSATRRHPIASHHQNPSPRSSNSGPKRTCMCSPTSHPGSFRCSLHKSSTNNNRKASFRSSHQLNMRRSAMTNSLVRIGTVEGDLVKRALAALIRPSSHSLRRRAGSQRQPSRLSKMSKAEEL
ncbi:hypothetical protein DH2020_013399 [Rehmannia glutinosa]|uniref:Serine-rich protein-like protein n=1 Tax=Rehmannia glutinosa TaxID=99300 RepID=A0ABR0X5Q8_REHGL